MPFFTYSQNNSGGDFRGPHYVIVEAPNSLVADAIAEGHGVYFWGTDDERDCACCGDRWSQAYGLGDPEPMIYGSPAAEYPNHRYGRAGVTVIHYLDGREVRI